MAHLKKAWWVVTERAVRNGCGSVGRAVASNTRRPWFKTSHRKTFYIEHLFSVNCIEKTKIKKKRPGMVHFKIEIER